MKILLTNPMRLFLFLCMVWSIDFSNTLDNSYLPGSSSSIGRRGLLFEQLPKCAAFNVLGAGLGGGPAIADTTDSNPPSKIISNGGGLSFDVYNVIPDASARLDPTLAKLENQKFLYNLARSKKGGAIWLGEHHNSDRDHMFQAKFIRSVYQERARRHEEDPLITIGLEQVQVQFQPVLDAFIRREISLQECVKLVEWEKRWVWPFELYQTIFETAQQLQIRLLALNVNSEDLSMVEKDGYPGLPKDRLRTYITDPVGFGKFAMTRQFNTYVNYVIAPSYDIHRDLGLLRNTITGEKLAEEMPFRNFLSGRILWDEGMASTAYSWTKENPGGLLIGLVGADHVKFRNGIPGRYERLASNSRDCTSIVINPTLIDSRPSGSVSNLENAYSASYPELITLQLRYLKDSVDPTGESRTLPESTGGVLPFADYLIIA